MATRGFSAWCERCATRVTIATEETADEARNVDAHTPGVDMEANMPCPSCEGKLHDLDKLMAYEEVPRSGWKRGDEPRVHAEWRASVAKGHLVPLPGPAAEGATLASLLKDARDAERDAVVAWLNDLSLSADFSSAVSVARAAKAVCAKGIAANAHRKGGR